MINKHDMELAETERWNTIVDTVIDWARKNEPNQYNYNSRMTYWGSALRAGIISRDDYEQARKRYGALWDYVGD